MTSRLGPIRALALTAILAGCGGGSSSAPAARPKPATEGELDLAALARSIDPGEVPPLSAGAPPMLAQAFEASSGANYSPEQLATEATSVGGALTGSSGQIDLRRVLMLVYLADQIERRMSECKIDCLAAAERIYAIADVPWLADPEAFLGQLLALSALAGQEMPAEQAKPIFEYLQRAFARAPLRHRYIAARILRTAPASEAATETLRSLARRAARDGDYPQAVRLRKAVLARAPLGFSDLLDLSSACLLAEELDCAVEALGRARATSGAEPERVTSVERDMVATRRIRELASARGLDAALERAHLLVDVGRRQEATAALDRLAAANPRDARPLVGLARAWFSDAKVKLASDLVARARPLDHKDERFYELAVGLTFQRLMGLLTGGAPNEEAIVAAVVAHLPELRADVDQLARFKPGVGGVLQVVVGRLQEGAGLIGVKDVTERRKRLAALTAGAMDEALALHARMPAEPDVYRLIYMIARFAGRASGERAVALDIPPGVTGRDDLLLMKAGLLYSFAVSWTDKERVAAITRTLDQLSAAGSTGPLARSLRVDAKVLEARMLGRAERWSELADAYRTLLHEGSDEDRSRLANNVGVALWESGDKAGARGAWTEAVTAGDPHHVARLNLAATAETPDLAALDQIADGSDRVGVQVQAVHWKIARAGLKGAARKRALKRAQGLLASTTVGDAADGSSGVVLEESFNVGVGYSTRDRLLVQLYLGRSAFLLVPAPGAGKAARVTDASRARRSARP
jgi:tetratricopeptide (TPR) repeat protein